VRLAVAEKGNVMSTCKAPQEIPRPRSLARISRKRKPLIENKDFQALPSF
jgi:hypothetical protein